ncbi:MAG TPA: nucleotidyl transferase AbiEii/AbiGii toxin family protein [Leucothrix mucor]|nr:nucleotidyl transferase AbiEii/AbiGii toxin family protein [Leucothrix mucor]
MNLFDQLVNEAIQKTNQLSALRVVVEKELLHHDIIREMSRSGLLEQLTFMGGTCLRACYGSNRLSEDLDFTGGHDFDKSSLSQLSKVLKKQLQAKYGLQIEVSEPKRETGNVDTWKLKIITRPEQRSIPMQRINIDICSIPSYDRKPSVLRNHYGVDMGTSGLLLQIESREEIFADKIIAFALRPNRLKNRDLWDIAWLTQQGIKLPIELVEHKIKDHQQTRQGFIKKLLKRKQELVETQALEAAFKQEMRRFLPADIVNNTIDNEVFWDYIKQVVSEASDDVIAQLKNKGETFKL